MDDPSEQDQERRGARDSPQRYSSRYSQRLPRIAGKSGFVFTTTGRSRVSGFSKAKQAIDASMVEILEKDRGEDAVAPPHWTLHDLRRTVATNLQKLGVRLEVTEAVLNHTSGSRAGIVGVYQRHKYATEKRRLSTYGRGGLRRSSQAPRRRTSSNWRRRGDSDERRRLVSRALAMLPRTSYDDELLNEAIRKLDIPRERQAEFKIDFDFAVIQ